MQDRPQEPLQERLARWLPSGPPQRRQIDADASGLRRGRDLAARHAVFIVLVVMVAIFSGLSPNTFPTVGNWVAMVQSQAILLVLALGVTIPLRSGDFDLSIAATMGFTGAVTGVLTANHGVSTWVAIIIALCVGLAIGSIHALLIVGIGLDAFVTTLGTMTALGGLAFAVTNSFIITGLPDDLLEFSRHKIFRLPLSAFYGWGLAIVLWYVYQYTPIGRFLLFVGGNRDASRLAGLPVKRIRALAFISAAVISSFAGVLLVGTIGAVDPSIGPSFLLAPYAAAFLGATTIQPGRFNVWGTVLALYLIIVGITGLQLLGAQPWVTDLFTGSALVAALLFARFTRARAT